MTTTNPIAAYLKTYHKGAERVVSSRELEAAFQIRGPARRIWSRPCPCEKPPTDQPPQRR